MLGSQDAFAVLRDGRTVEERTRSKEWKQRVSNSRSQLSQWQGDRQQGAGLPFPSASLRGVEQGPGFQHSMQGENKAVITQVGAMPNHRRIDREEV